MKKIVLELLVGALLVPAVVCTVNAQEGNEDAFTVTGKIYSPTSLPKFGNVTNITEVTFYRTQDQWKILSIPVKKVVPMQSMPASPTEYGMVDMTNTYENYHFSLNTKEELNASNHHSLNFHAGPVPESNILWFAFWGGTYLNGKENADSIESPFAISPGYDRRLHVKAKWKIHDEKAKFPMVESYTSYIGEKRWFYDRQTGGILKPTLTSVSKKNQGLPDVSYQVLEWTNVLGQDFPLKVIENSNSLSSYEEKEKFVTGKRWLEIEKITPGVPENIFELKVQPKTQIYDKRFWYINTPITYNYLSKDGEWQSLEEIKASPKMKELISDAIEDSMITPGSY
jgi:hypothetical protein